ncbi:NAD-dependent protein deacylase [Neobacillus niacini]|uniref:NAD-dependent protein deacylase n=1 Tax=Neobacillus niacini TaxID=86668 RepID=UPI0028601F19|nr:NAD-dependent protein deacylase [Neobacillus niacini]MDR6999275.1 NAD-dependent deacetylase [Neobacillus niacini]
MEDQIHTLKQWIENSKYTVIFTGAGMSTESGLPDFRSASTGIWKDQNPMKLASTDAMKNNRYGFIEFYQNRVEEVEKYKPHFGHEVLAQWEQEGKLKAIITQNIDGFHQEAGSKNVVELHGTLRKCHCSECKETFPILRFMEEKLSCECGGFIRPSVVLFGERLMEVSLIHAVRETKQAELFIVLGSSLNVSPANFFPIEAKENEAKLVIINMEPTEMDDLADLVIPQRKIGEVLQELSQ